ncbi:unnamed protein product [Schistosoma haematobium]|nr:unnamed protein product [Schistosoma haematobium]
MQKSIRANEHQLYYLVNKARENGLAKLSGNLWKRSLDTGKWQLRYFILYQNLLFYFDGERAERPSGVIFLESSYCEPNVNLKSGRDDKTGGQQGNYFTISYRKEGVRQYDLRADTEEECFMWVDAINGASFSKLLELKQEAEQKQLHLSQILETEQRAKWHYVKQIEELTAEIKQLKYEFNEYRIDRRFNLELENESEELRKVKKVQSFFRGWLCRRRWKQIVEEYIRSDHAESMRRRNSIVFGLVECEDEYVQQLSILVTCYLRPFRMAASSKKPIVSHEDVNSIFLNAEAVLFLHQVFVQGLRNKMENWPTLQLGDLFDLLLPMLGIYQEYVRNHHYSLQVLAEYKQRPEFTHMLKRLEEKPLCEGRSIESFLTYPMHQIPRYIITLHELLAHTPYDHVDRKKLEFATSKLEQISHIMHDEVSETENMRKNLAIERMIVDGCDLLLDVNQVFVRQGTLIQVMCDKLRSSRPRLGNFGSSYRERKEAVRQVFLFTNHLLITARTNNGKLRLVKNCGKISLVECTLVEDTTTELFNVDDEDQLNVTNEQKCQQDNTSHMTKNNTTPLNVNTNVELNTRNSIPMSTLGTTPTINTTTTSNSISNTTYELGQQLPQNLHKRYICPDSTLNRYTYVNKSNQMDSISRSTTITGTVQQQSIPCLSPQHRHSTSLCIGSNISNNENELHDAVTNCCITPICSTDSYSPSINTIDEARVVLVTTVTTMTTANIVTATTMNSTNTSSSSILHGRNNSNVSYSTITSPIITTIITPDINITNSSPLLTSSSSCIQPTSPLSFSMLHRFSSNMGLFNSINNNNNNNTCINDKTDYGNLDFRLIWEPKNGQPTSIWLVASTLQEKAAWCSDISQCIEQLHYGDILNSAQSDVSSVAMPQSIRSDPKLFKDDVDIKFSHTLNSCKVPQIRYATVSRLLDRLTDARFLSIDFLNTFLLTYRVFTTGLSVIWALNQVLANPDVENGGNALYSNQNQSIT